MWSSDAKLGLIKKYVRILTPKYSESFSFSSNIHYYVIKIVPLRSKFLPQSIGIKMFNPTNHRENPQ